MRNVSTALLLAVMFAVPTSPSGMSPLALAGQPGAAGQPAARSSAADILNMDSNWRWYATFRKPVVPISALKAAGLKADAPRLVMGADAFVSSPPLSPWQAPDFDDGSWSSGAGRAVAETAFWYYSTSLVCLRGKFMVTDPADVKTLELTLKYRGGAVVYLNGREVARQDLPAGPLSPDAAATAYPEEAFVDATGKVIVNDPYARGKLPADQRQDQERRIATRDRLLGPVVRAPSAAWSGSLLRKGVNVLAIELHRSEYPPAALKWISWSNRHDSLNIRPVGWPLVELVDVRLQAGGRGALPNHGRPQGLQVWIHDRNDRVLEQDFGDPCESERALKIVAAKNGSFCGQVVLGSTGALQGATATVDDLVAVEGSGKIPASQVTVLYGLLDRTGYALPRWCDGLQEEPPAEIAVSKTGGAALLPMLFRVHVPRDAPAGEYRGKIKISAASAPAWTVPVELSVADWTVPDPWQYRTYIGIYQSPTSLALQYQVPEWSAEHWKLMEKSFALLGRVGNKLVNVTVVDHTQFGNDDGMITWQRKADGSYTYDFTVFDRYMELARKYCGPLDYVALHVWHSGGWETRKADQANTVTVVDRQTGRREHVQVPVFGTAESKKFWKPLLDQAYQHLQRVGMERAMCLGILSDGTAPPEVFRAFDEIWPGGGPARWTRGLHSAFRNVPPYPHAYRADRGGGQVVLHEFCYGNPLADPEKPLPPIWRFRGCPGTMYWRLQNLEDAGSLVWNRTLAEQSLFRYNQGVGRICLDFWNVANNNPGADRGVNNKFNIYNRFPSSSCAQRAPALFYLTWPGPQGAASTVRFEAFCEGLQLAEADIIVSEALDTHAAELGAELCAECRQLLVDRLWYLHSRDLQMWSRVFYHVDHCDWQQLDRRLLDCAAKVGAKLRK